MPVDLTTGIEEVLVPEKSKTVIQEDPKVVLNRFLRELLYGFIAFLITELVNWAIPTLTLNELGWLIPVLFAFQHALVKALEKFNIRLAKAVEFEPFYKGIWTTVSTGAKFLYGKISALFKKK